MKQPMALYAQQEAVSRAGWAAFCLVAYLLYAIVGINPFGADAANSQITEGNLANQLVGLGLTLLLLVMTWRPGKAASNLALPLPVALLMAYCLLTLIWSAVPDIGFRRWVQALITMWVLFRTVGELGYARTLWFVRMTMLFLLVANYFAVAFLDHGVHPYQFAKYSSVVGNWRGILYHKNLTGSVTAITILLFTFDRRGVSSLFFNAVVLAGLVFLYFTQSKSSMSALAVALMAGFAIRFVKLSGNAVWITRIVLGLLMILPLAAILVGSQLEQLMDRDSFTGRARIWSSLLLYAQEHFWTGSGFGSFWHVGSVSPILSLANGWVADQAGAAHNGYLEMMVSTGFPGLLLTLLALLILPTQRLLAADAIPTPCISLLFSVITFCMLNNLAESQLMEGKGIDQMFLIIVIALIGLAAPLSGSGGMNRLHRLFQRGGS